MASEWLISSLYFAKSRSYANRLPTSLTVSSICLIILSVATVN